MLSDQTFGNYVVSKVNDTKVRGFWIQEYEPLHEHTKHDMRRSTLSRIRRLLTHPSVANWLGQKEDRIITSRAMDNNKIILADLSKGKIGTEAARLFDGLLLNQIYLAAMSRVWKKPAERQWFGLIVDEFHNYF